MWSLPYNYFWLTVGEYNSSTILSKIDYHGLSSNWVRWSFSPHYKSNCFIGLSVHLTTSCLVQEVFSSFEDTSIILASYASVYFELGNISDEISVSDIDKCKYYGSFPADSRRKQPHNKL